MPIGVCPRCQHRFMFEAERSPQRICPRCLRPLSLTPGAWPAPPPAERIAAAGPGGFPGRWLNDLPLPAHPLGQRLRAALAEAACQSARAGALRQQARELQRGSRSAPEQEGAGSSVAAPVREREQAFSLSGAGPGMSPVEVAGLLIEKARFLAPLLQATMERSRRSRTERQHHTAASPPPADSTLPPLLRELFPEGETLPEPLPEPYAPEGTAWTTLYLWGYWPPRRDLWHEEYRETAAAAAFAAESGWDERRAGAWAQEISLPLGFRDALRALEPVLRQDPAVQGWGIAMRRRRLRGW